MKYKKMYGNQSTVIDKIRSGTDNSLNVLDKSVAILNIDKKSLALKDYNLLFYFNDYTCSTCIDEAIADLDDMVYDNLNKIILVVSYKDERDYLFLDEKIDHKYKVHRISTQETPILSPIFLIVDKDGIIINAHTYIKEFPNSNKMFLISANKRLSS
jgi:hypothetical protein